MTKRKANLGICIIALLSFACGKKTLDSTPLSVQTGAIVGGQKVKEGNFASVAALTSNGSRFCSANLIEKTKVSTAAHCFLSTQFGSNTARQNFLNDLNIALIKNLGTEVQAIFQEMNKDQKRKIIKATMRSMMIKTAKETGIYFGPGKLGGRNMHGEKIIKNITFDSKWIDLSFADVFGKTALGNEADKALKYNAIIDKVTIELKNPIENIAPVPFITPDEHYENVLIGNSVELVGFGLEVDARYLSYAAQMIKELQEKINNEKDKTKSDKLKKELAEAKAMNDQFQALYHRSGEKRRVTVKLENYDHLEMKLRAIHERNAQGACSGDSGGPVFTELSNGEKRQIAIMTAVDFCGRSTFAAPTFKK